MNIGDIWKFTGPQGNADILTGWYVQNKPMENFGPFKTYEEAEQWWDNEKANGKSDEH